MQTSLSTNSDVQLVKHDQGRTQVILKLFSVANVRNIMKHNLNTQNWLDMNKYIQCNAVVLAVEDWILLLLYNSLRKGDKRVLKLNSLLFTVYCLQTDQPESIA